MWWWMMRRMGMECKDRVGDVNIKGKIILKVVGVQKITLGE